MNVFKKVFCRIYQSCFKLAMPILPYRQPVILDSLNDIPTLLSSKLNCRSVLLVTDSFLRKTESFKSLESAIENKNVKCIVYSETRPNPTVNNVEEAFTLYKKHNCSAIIAFGGGSSMDCAKAVGARAVYPKKPLSKMKGLLRVLKKLPPLIAIPTTAGTGSEVTVTAVITDSEKKHKYTMNNFTMIPRYAVLDPEVTYSLPKHLTSTTGMDALTHAVEAFIGNSTNKETRECALKATKLIFENIETAYVEPENYIARKNMLTASYLAGRAFTKSYVGYIHAVAHSLGGEYNIPHGLANAVIMPLVLREYGGKIDKKLSQLAKAAGILKGNESEKEAAEKFIKAIEDLNERMNIQKSFPEINEADINKMALHADKEANPLYPVPVLWNAKELTNIYLKVKSGK